MGKHCGWIRDILIINNFSEKHQYHPPISWLEYYKFPLSLYQKHNFGDTVPYLDSDSEDESSDEEYIPSAVERKEKSYAGEDISQEAKEDSGHELEDGEVDKVRDEMEKLKREI